MSALQGTELPDEAPKQTKRARWRKLETVQQVRQALAAVVRKTYDGHLDPMKANACIGGLRALGRVLHDSDLEQRILELERRLNQ